MHSYYLHFMLNKFSKIRGGANAPHCPPPPNDVPASYHRSSLALYSTHGSVRLYIWRWRLKFESERKKKNERISIIAHLSRRGSSGPQAAATLRGRAALKIWIKCLLVIICRQLKVLGCRKHGRELSWKADASNCTPYIGRSIDICKDLCFVMNGLIVSEF